jgi:hypothetical protein
METLSELMVVVVVQVLLEEMPQAHPLEQVAQEELALNHLSLAPL